MEAFLVYSERAKFSFPARFRYDCSDPYAVQVQFPAVDSGHAPTTWAFARNLLEEGQRVTSGEGDVRIIPCGLGYVGMELRNDSMRALILLTAEGLRRFLSETYRRVPAGHEHHQLDLDDALTRLLGRTH
ncbi:SsgA family sporulation/cell division regulator [Streptomyces sp. MMS20-AI2-20]|uniref:SsgA family sporulation/cell division regulator n=1 Tax=Streptomyces TaxID=1883 RepID=UPI001F61A591|nr:SsgA family sporulation/cell division regulator [Streptomyces sp. MMS20-AI2-20]MCI4146586.1 SsgA family sporulation/cell division regulator [Streptomyces sp. MMS20-AI2-20]